MTDTITVIRSRRLRLAKTIHADGRTIGYGQARTLDLFEQPLSGLDSLRDLLGRMIHAPHCAAVFGGIADPARTRGVRRLAYPDPETGDLATLRTLAHRWCALDMDGVERPEAVPAHNLAACHAQAVQRLPVAFHSARCIVQATAGHGIKPGCRLRLWYWLDRLTAGDELAAWLKGLPVDPCTFRTAQPIYTAAPVFIDRPDHLPCRIVDVPGAAAVAVPAADTLKPPPRVIMPSSPDRETATDADAEAFISRVIDRVKKAPDGSKHYTLRNAARLLGGIQAVAAFTDAEAERWLVEALPSSAADLAAAGDTVRWGLEAGRGAPIPVPCCTPRQSDPRRRETARAAFRLIRMGVPSDELLATLHDINTRRPEPLPANDIDATALWAAAQPKERRYGR